MEDTAKASQSAKVSTSALLSVSVCHLLPS
jgi:hypothetical protein